YRKVAEQVKPNPLIIRTFDLGGDKLAAGAADVGDEMNPFLGWRAIRFCLENIDIFKTQLRAIWRASAVGNVKIMFPMISGLDELSVGATSVPRVKMAVRSLAVPECQQLVDEVLQLQTSSEILARCLELATKRYGDLLG